MRVGRTGRPRPFQRPLVSQPFCKTTNLGAGVRIAPGPPFISLKICDIYKPSLLFGAAVCSRFAKAVAGLFSNARIAAFDRAGVIARYFSRIRVADCSVWPVTAQICGMAVPASASSVTAVPRTSLKRRCSAFFAFGSSA